MAKMQSDALKKVKFGFKELTENTLWMGTRLYKSSRSLTDDFLLAAARGNIWRLAKIADILEVSDYSEYGQAFVAAANNNQIEMMDYILERPEVLAAPSFQSWKNTALIQAAARGADDVYKRGAKAMDAVLHLNKLGADITYWNYDALEKILTCENYVGVAKAFNVEAIPPAACEKLLQAAVFSGNVDNVNYVLERAEGIDSIEALDGYITYAEGVLQDASIYEPLKAFKDKQATAPETLAPKERKL